jgi:hypothetical protein
VGTPVALDRVIEALCDIERRSGVDRTLAVGELILNQFFGGNPAIWRDRRRNKNCSIRRLANRADCPFCKSALHEAVAVYVASLDMPFVRTFGHIGASHVACVLKLSLEERAELLHRAERECLSVRELRRHVRALRSAAGERRGRSRQPARAGLSSMRRGAELVREGLASFASAESVRDEHARLDELATELIRQVERLTRGDEPDESSAVNASPSPLIDRSA